MPRYQQIAHDLGEQIYSGNFAYGQRLPALRKLARQLQVSVTTVLEAYSQLQQLGLIEARPQAGFFVCHQHTLLARPPESASLAPAQLRLGQRIDEVRANSQNPQNYHFGLAIPHPDCLPQAALAKAASQVIRHQTQAMASPAPAPGNLALRQQICQLMVGAGCFIHADQVIISNGCQEALFLALQTLTQPGDVVAVESPCYHGFLLALQSLQLTVVTIACDPQTGMDLAALEQAASQWPIKVCLCSPCFSNPSGAVMSDSNKRALLQLAQRFDFSVIEDDIFAELGFSSPRPRPLLAFDKDDRVIYCSSFSKTIAPGLRIGWLITARRQQQIIDRQMATTTGAASLPQLLLQRFLASGQFQPHLQRSRRLYQANQQRALAVIAKHFPAGTQASQPNGGFVLWIALPPTLDSYRLYQQALIEQISIVPGSLFARQGFNNYLRINYARPWTQRAEQKLARIGALATLQQSL